MRLIDADALLDDIRLHSASYFADDFAREWVDKQPTIDAEPKWISCSESLPKERKRVLVCLDAPINQICVSQRVDTNYWIGLGRVNVVAWMELPKAFEEDE